jgi:predicted ArsR family transcriptional regulator
MESAGRQVTQRLARGQDQQVHRALSSPVRGRIVELLAADGPMDARDLADRMELHVNTVRAHLTVLVESELVASSPEERDRPGRPRLLYRATDTAGDRGGAGGYRFLAEVLASHLAATADDPAGVAEQAGTAWGRFLVDAPAPFTSVDRQAAIKRVAELLDSLGFEPELDDRAPDAPRILLRRCPFLQVAREHQDVVCSIHLGIMRGALSELGVDVEVRDLLPFAEPDLCVSHLHVPA